MDPGRDHQADVTQSPRCRMRVGTVYVTVRAPLARIHAYMCTAIWPRIVAIVRDNLQRRQREPVS